MLVWQEMHKLSPRGTMRKAHGTAELTWSRLDGLASSLAVEPGWSQPEIWVVDNIDFLDGSL